MTHTGNLVLGLAARHDQPDRRVAHVARAKTERLIDEVDLPLNTIGVDEQDDARIRCVIVHARDPHPCRQEVRRSPHGARAALEVDVLAHERCERCNLARALLQEACPERNRLATDEHYRTINAERLQQPKYPLHLLVSEGRLGGHRCLPERTRGRKVNTRGPRKPREKLVLPTQLLHGLPARAQVALVRLARRLLLTSADTVIETLILTLHRPCILPDACSQKPGGTGLEPDVADVSRSVVTSPGAGILPVR